MNAFEDAQYRLKIAQGFLFEARQDVQLGRWRSGVDNAQLAFPPEINHQVSRLVELGQMLGPDIHMQTDYGDEVGGRTPWELFSEKDAREALVMAEEAYALAEEITRLIFQ